MGVGATAGHEAEHGMSASSAREPSGLPLCMDSHPVACCLLQYGPVFLQHHCSPPSLRAPVLPRSAIAHAWPRPRQREFARIGAVQVCAEACATQLSDCGARTFHRTSADRT
jgi:hypothetical protein